MKKGTNTNPDVFIALAQAYESGNTFVTERIESILTPNASALPEVLQAALDKMGDSPIAEPEAYDALLKGNTDVFIALCTKGLELDAYDAITIGTFIGRARTRIITDVDKDGVFKTTPALDKMRLPKLSEIQEYSQMAKIGATEEEMTKRIMQIVGLEGVELSKWEESLAKSILVNYTLVTTDAFLGKVTDRTPFARYLKNI